MSEEGETGDGVQHSGVEKIGLIPPRASILSQVMGGRQKIPANTEVGRVRRGEIQRRET